MEVLIENEIIFDLDNCSCDSDDCSCDSNDCSRWQPCLCMGDYGC